MPDPSIDTPLIERLRHSDAEAFRLLFERYQPILFRQLLVRTREVEVAHDCVQETFLRIWAMRRTLKPELSFPGLAFRIGGNLVRDHLRRRQTHDRLRDVIPPPPRSEGDDPADALALTLLEEELAKILNDELPERCRTIYLLSKFEGLTNREIAEFLGIAVKTVENQITKGSALVNKRLRRFLQSTDRKKKR